MRPCACRREVLPGPWVSPVLIGMSSPPGRGDGKRYQVLRRRRKRVKRFGMPRGMSAASTHSDRHHRGNDCGAGRLILLVTEQPERESFVKAAFFVERGGADHDRNVQDHRNAD